MQLVLPVRMAAAVYALLETRPLNRVELERGWKPRASGYDVIVDLPFVSWLLVRDDLIEHLAGRPRVPIPAHKTPKALLRRVATATNRMERHPALSGQALKGEHFDRFYAWRLPEPDDKGRMFTLAPTQGCEFAVLRPSWRKINQWLITSWGPHGLAPTHDRLSVESFHWDLFTEQ
jgi:hypothetical protein